jgi:hypothetical protein
MMVKRRLANVLREIIGPIHERRKAPGRDPDHVIEILQLRRLAPAT